MAVTLGEIQAALGAELSGDREQVVSAVNTLANAGPSDVAFIADKRYWPLNFATSVRLTRSSSKTLMRHMLVPPSYCIPRSPGNPEKT